ncbi:GNAT family N-acetyltransferase [Halobacteriales archaeon SW_7_71_33]|nr:MAG: GNAT family N-acetyltransferase [Halobacteriales archaeon SW_7_71_33]
MTEYGPVRDGDETAFWRLVNYAFSPSEGPFDPDDAAAPNDVGDPRTLYDGDELVAGCRHYDLSVDLREDAVDTGGIGVLASDPGRRRESNVRRLLAASLAEYRDEGRRLALLWPFDYEFYGALGWATVSKLARWEVAPDALDGLAAATAPGGDAGFERLTAEDWRRLVPVRRADGADTDLLVRRSASWWREFVFDRWDRTPYVYAWVVDGNVRGYLVYAITAEGDDRVMTVREHAARDADARRQLFRFCRDHDSQVDRVRFYTLTGAVAGEGFDPHLHLDDPGAADATVSAGGMARLVDVAADLPAVVGPGVDATASDFDLVVDDPLADWNDGRFRVTVTSGGGLDLRRVDEGADDLGSAPTVRLGVDALSQVVVGARTPEQLARAGTVDGDETAIAALGDCFPPRNPVLGENF